MATVCQRHTTSQPTWKHLEALPPLSWSAFTTANCKKKKKSRPNLTNRLFKSLVCLFSFSHDQNILFRVACLWSIKGLLHMSNQNNYVDLNIQSLFQICGVHFDFVEVWSRHKFSSTTMTEGQFQCWRESHCHFFSGLKNLLKIDFTSISTRAGIRNMCCGWAHFSWMQVFMAWTADQLELYLKTLFN